MDGSIKNAKIKPEIMCLRNYLAIFNNLCLKDTISITFEI